MLASKSILLMSMLVAVSLTAQAQSEYTSSDFESEMTAPLPEAPRVQTWNQAGLQFSLNISNISDSNSYQTLTSTNQLGSGSSSLSSTNGEGVETYAIEAGYNSLPARGLGWYAGGFVRKTLQNGTELTEAGYIGVRGNAQYAFNKWVYCYLGANLTDIYEYSKFDPSGGSITYQPNVSGQAGFGFRINRALSIYAGYENTAVIEKYTFSPPGINFSQNGTNYIYMDSVTTGLSWTL